MKTYLILSYVDASTGAHVVNARDEHDAKIYAIKNGAIEDCYDIFEINTKVEGCVFNIDTVLV